MILKGKGGIQYNLEATPFAQGGEGQIFNIIGHSDKVAKLYKAGKITPNHERKLLKMVITPPEQDVLDQIAWPLDVLYDNNKFVGFVMRKFKLNEDLNVIYEYGSSAKYPELTWGNKIRIAKNLCVVLNAVHEAGHVCGDFNPKNISVDPNTGHITFVDTDSYHITDGSNTYRCNVGMPEYLPVEIQKKMYNGLSNAALPTFSQATDNFALAVHIFQLLMNGVHPFACAIIPSQDSVPIPDTSDSILKGECPFFKNVPGKQIPKFAPPADILPQEIKKLFLLAFVDGHNDPGMRPSAEVWYYALERLENNLKKCNAVGYHEYHNSQNVCPWCEADKRFNGALSSASKGKGLKQSSFTPPVVPPTRNSGYTPSSVSVSSTRGSSSATYVGAGHRGSAANYKKGNFIQKLIKGIIIAALIILLFCFVIWPNMPNNDFDIPEIVQVYSGYYDDRYNYSDVVITISSCDPSGKIEGYCEFIIGGSYCKYEINGEITSKKNNGDCRITIALGQLVINTYDFAPSFEEIAFKISNKYSVLESSYYYLKAGENDEYTIKNADDLQKLAGSGSTYMLKNNIDLGGAEIKPIEGFTGTLFGHGFTIENFSINSMQSNVGLFSTMEGFVSNLTIKNAKISTTGRTENVGVLCGTLKGTVVDVNILSCEINAPNSNYVGSVAGYVGKLTNGAIVSNLTSDSVVIGRDYVGGIFGSVTPASNGDGDSVTFMNLSNKGAISGENYVGGIFGNMYFNGSHSIIHYNFPAYLIDITNEGSVTGKTYVGGIVGSGDTDTSDSYIQNCSNRADIIADAMAGCIAGYCDLTIDSCTNEGSTLTANGFLMEDGNKSGYIGGYVGKGAVINNCTNTVSISYNGGGRYVGGILGYSINYPKNAMLSNLSNKANISGSDYVGGIFGGVSPEVNGDGDSIAFNNMRNEGAITGETYVGGILGYLYINGSHSIIHYDFPAYLTAMENEGKVKGNDCVGGIIGYGRTDTEVSELISSTSTQDIEGNSNVGNLIGKAEKITIR